MPPPAEGFATRLIVGPALRTQPDRRLVTLVREGYEAAFEEIVRRYGKPLRGYAASIVGVHAEDVTQDAFSKALLALRRDGAEIELRPWLYRIVRNTALNDLRDRPPAPEAIAETIANGRSAAEEAEQREQLTELIERLRALPEPQRAAIVMRELEGLSHEEIAANLGLSGGGARQAIYRARQALRDGLGMLLPLPLLKSMLGTAGPATAEAAAGAAGVGSAAGVGLTLKAAAATVLVAGAVGAGVALDQSPRTGAAAATPPAARGGSARAASTPASEGAKGSDSGERGTGMQESEDGGHHPSGGAAARDRGGSTERGVEGSGHGGDSGNRDDDHHSDQSPGEHSEHDGEDDEGNSEHSEHSGSEDRSGHDGDFDSGEVDLEHSDSSPIGDDGSHSGSDAAGESSGEDVIPGGGSGEEHEEDPVIQDSETSSFEPPA